MIAADGIRSTIREALFHPAPPVFSGFVAGRGLVETAKLPRELHESAVAFGQGRHMNRYLVRRGELLNFVAVARRDEWEPEGWNIPAPLDGFRRSSRASTREPERSSRGPSRVKVFKWGLFGRPWLDEWFPRPCGAVGRRGSSDAPVPRSGRCQCYRGRDDPHAHACLPKPVPKMPSRCISTRASRRRGQPQRKRRNVASGIWANPTLTASRTTRRVKSLSTTQ